MEERIMKSTKGYWFTDGTLKYGDGRKPRVRILSAITSREYLISKGEKICA